MPEYSSTTITPADGVKTPAMNGSTSGNYTLADLRAFILASKGLANGLASLDANGKLTSSQLPDLADDVIVVASYATLPNPGIAGKIYITRSNPTNAMYRWDDSLATPDYVELSVDLSNYATKTELAAEESAREAEDTNLKNAISQIDHRVQNLEQAKGDYVVQNYKDGSITPSGKGNWAVVEGLRGVSRVENNLSDIADGSSGTGNTIGTHFTTFQYSHFYLFALRATFPSQPTSGGGSASPSTPIYLGLWNNALTSFQRHPFAYQSSGNYAFVGSGASLDGNLTDGSSAKVVLQTFPNTGELCTFADVLITDLNIYFGTSDLSFLGATDSAKLATIQSDYPHLHTPSDYGTRIVDSSYSGVRAWARNLWDEVAEVGGIGAGGVNNGETNRIRSKNFIPCLPNTSYFFQIPSPYQFKAFFYASDETFISDSAGFNTARAETTPAGCYFMRFSTSASYGTTYNDDICVNQSDSLNGTYTPYHAPSTLSLTYSGKSAGSVYDQLETNAEIVQEIDGQKVTIYKKRTTERVGSVLIPDLPWDRGNNGGYWNEPKFYVQIPDMQAVGLEDILSIYVPTSEGTSSMPNMSIKAFASNNYVYIRDDRYNSVADFKTAMAGVPIYYPKATPVVTLSDPLIDNTLLTESGGRMATVQTGTVVDGSFDIGFINL